MTSDVSFIVVTDQLIVFLVLNFVEYGSDNVSNFTLGGS